MDRRYRMELQLVKVPVVWKAKVPEKKLKPVTRRMSEKRRFERHARIVTNQFFAGLFAGVPDEFTPPEFRETKQTGKVIIFKRFSRYPKVGWPDGPAADN